MDKQTLIQSALASMLALGLASSPALAADDAKEKCFGVAKAGANDCASANGSHACAGQAKKDNDANEWKYVAKGSCEKMGGKPSAAKKG